jgi:hypothetical protein
LSSGPCLPGSTPGKQEQADGWLEVAHGASLARKGRSDVVLVFPTVWQATRANGDFLPESPTWEEVFAGVPTAPGTQAQQSRHKQLRQQEEMTEEEEAELNELFYAIYPQFRPADQ